MSAPRMPDRLGLPSHERVARLVAIIDLLDKTSDEDYPPLRDQIVEAGELDYLPTPYNPLALGIALTRNDPATIERESLRACLLGVLMIAYSCHWLQPPPAEQSDGSEPLIRIRL